MSKEIIRLDNISKTYEMGSIYVEALKNVTLSINEGDFVAVMGASGSGKSTLMNILGCLDRPTDGSYFIDGVDVSEKTDDQLSQVRNRNVGFIFQSFNLIPRTTALKNVELPMVYAKIPQDQRKKRAMELLAGVGLSDRHNHMPNELSGGQKQRVAIARALANRPPIILADEPTGNLDSKSSTEIMEIFRKLNKEEGNTVIVVTHEPDIAKYTDRIITFLDGEILCDTASGCENGEVL